MDMFIARQNIEHYKQVLAVEIAPAKRQAILRLLAEEEAKLMALECPSSPAATATPATTEGEVVSHLNLRYYRERLKAETDIVIRQILLRLIAEDEEKARSTLPEAGKSSGND